MMSRTKYSLRDMQKLAISRNGKCLSKKYISVAHALIWQCEAGHRWKQIPSNVLSGRWCQLCSAEKQRIGIEYFKELAHSKGGKCLSKKYINAHTKLKFCCQKGHVFTTRPLQIKNHKQWCATCVRINQGDSQKLTRKEINLKIKDYGIECISQRVSEYEPLNWRCKKEHVFGLPWYRMRAKPYCRACKRANLYKNIFNRLSKICKIRGGAILNNILQDPYQKIDIRCSEGHTWSVKPAALRSGHWCPKCANLTAGDYHKHDIDECRKIAVKRGGKCLSTTYKNWKEKLEWKCSCGDIWSASLGSVTRGSWCPACSGGFGERLSRIVMEHVFQAKFQKARPKWLMSSDGFRLELDGFNKKKGIAFEHHGEQHFNTNTHFIKSTNLLKKRKQYDRRKRFLCRKNNIILIEIPEIFSELDPKELQQFIIKKATDVGLRVPKVGLSPANLDLAYTSRTKQVYLEMKSLAADHSGHLLSKSYKSAQEKLQWKCSRGHVFSKDIYSIRKGIWCNECKGVRRLKPIDLMNFAKKKGGMLLSRDYLGYHINHKWSCKKGHIWEARPGNIFVGKWCPLCAVETRSRRRKSKAS